MKSLLTLTLAAFGIYFSTPAALAVSSTSPYSTTTANTTLNQSSTDNINGQLTTSTHAPSAGSLSSLTDATSSTTPTASVLVGPDNQTVRLSWDFGTAVDPSTRRLETLSLWFTVDSQRNGFNGSLATSLDGQNFTAIDNSAYNAQFGPAAAGNVPNNFHHILYNFTGTNVSNFRFLQLNSSGFANVPGDPTFQPLFVEIDAVVSVPEPSTVALLALGAGVLGFSAYRKNRKNAA